MKYLIILLFINLYGFDIKVSVNNLRNSKGIVQFNLYNKNGTIPDKTFNNYYKKLTSKISDNKVIVTFKNIPKGIYAIGVLHDENHNGKIDKGFILPIEGVGFTNFNKIDLFNKPNFKKASFNLNSNVTKTIKILYF